MSNPVFVKTVDNYITAAMKVLLGAAPGNTYLNQFRSFVTENGGGTKGLAAYASALANYAGTDNAALAATVVANLGITGADAATATANVKALFDSKGAARGDAVLQLIEIMVNLQGDATWGTVANNFVNGVNAAYVYSVNAANTSTDLAVLKAAVTTSATGVVGVPGSNLTLTDKIGESVVGTANDDVIKAVLGATGATTDSTLNLGDTIDGGNGTDTLNLIIAGTNTAFPSGVTISSVEKVRIDVTSAAAAPAAATVAASNFGGVTELWQIDNDATVNAFTGVTVSSAVTAGFASTNNSATAVAATATVTAAATSQKTVAIALDGVGSGGTLTVAPAGATLDSVTVNGSVAKAAASVNGTVTVVDGTATKALNLGLSSSGTVVVTDADNSLATVSASTSAGGLTIDLKALTGLTSVKGGAGNDTLTVNFETGKTLVVDAGAGNDTVILDNNGTDAAANKATSLTLGAGKDTLKLSATLTNMGNIQDASNASLASGLIIVEDFKTAEDVLDLSGKGFALTTNNLATIKGAADLAAAASATAGIIGAGKAAVFSFGSDAYVYVDGNGTGTFNSGDMLVKLVGVDAAQFSNVQNGNLVL